MNIQAIDGEWYSDPGWEGKRYYIHALDEVLLEYQGQVTWATARRVLAPLGIKAKLDIVHPDTKIIFNGRLMTASVFELHLTKPIPVPEYDQGYFNEAPNPLYNGETLSWKRSGKRWIPIGPTS